MIYQSFVVGLEAWWLCSSVVTGTSLGTSPDAWNAELIQLGSIGSNWFHGGSIRWISLWHPFSMAFFNGLVLDEPDACTKDCINLYVGPRRKLQTHWSSLTAMGPWIRAGHEKTDIDKWCAILWQATEPWVVRCLCLGTKKQPAADS